MAPSLGYCGEKMKVLWCHEVSYRSKPVYEYQDFPERLAAMGHQVEVIDFDEASASRASTELITRTGTGQVSLTTIPHSNVAALKYFQARWNFRRMLTDRLRAGHVDVIVLYSVFVNGTQAVEIARRFGVPVVYRVLDAYHRLHPNKFAQFLLKRGERYIYRNADRILVTNRHMAHYVDEVANFSGVPGKTGVLDHGADTEHFAPRPPDPVLLAKYKILPDDDVALFLGTTYGFSGLLNLVARMPGLLDYCPKLKLVIVGGGEQDEALAARVSELGLEGRVILTGMVSYEDVPRYLSLGKLALNPFEINDITRDIVPIKILQYQACGLPVLSTPLPDLVRVHPEGASGVIYCASDDADEFAAKMVKTMRNAGRLEQLALKGRKFILERFSVRYSISRLLETFTEVLKEREELK